MQRSWPRYVFFTPQGTGFMLHYLALLPPRVFSSKLARKYSAGCSNGYLRQYVCVYRCVCTESTQCYNSNILVRQPISGTGSSKTAFS